MSSVDFGRLFPALRPFADANDTVRSALLEVGKPGGIMDAGDDLAAGPKALIVDPTVNGNPTATNPYGTNPDNPAIAPHTQTGPTVLPQRNLLRQLTWGLPSGQAVARAMGVPALAASDLGDIAGVYAPFATSTPLWYYILAEAKIMAGGLNLGPVGGRIVTETLLGLLRADPTSYMSVYPRFCPFLGTDLTLGSTPDPNITGNRSYTRAHFLHYAGVVYPDTYRWDGDPRSGSGSTTPGPGHGPLTRAASHGSSGCGRGSSRRLRGVPGL